MSGPQRYIAHLDLDAFFVEVECLHDPSLRGRPLIVGGSRERGVVTTCSYEARKFGVRSAMPMVQAVRLCPQATVLPGSRGEYSRYSRMVTDIVSAGAPLFEKASIDEFYIDLTGMDRFHDPLGWTIDLRRRITEETGLPISFGLASNKMVAKIATGEAKPNGYLQVLPGHEASFLAPLPVGAIPGVGGHTAKALHELGISTIGDLASYPAEALAASLGHSAAAGLQRRARGGHDGEVEPWQEAKSISTEHTFGEDVGETGILHAELVRMTEKVARQLREQDRMAGCLAVKIRYPDFETTSRQASIPFPCYDDELIPVAHALFRRLHRERRKVRLLGVRISELTSGARQSNLFSDEDRKSQLYKAIDSVKDRFGRDALTRGGAMDGMG